jgi:predicted helicase
MWSSYVSEHLLPRLFGFELLMAPYAVAHLKLGLQLRDMGYDLEQDERLNVYLTNTLEEAQEASSRLPFAQWLAEEANAASRIKQEEPVMVVLGNPPYSGHSVNTGAWVAGLLRGFDTQTGEKTGNYFAVDGKPLGERNPKWLNDDYVKFIRFAQWRIEQTGYGVLAFITNHGYLDNPTFRGMRQSLMETFDDIYVLDLHGNAKKKERAPDGSKDENVFDIQQGVAIGIFIKRQKEKESLAKVHHADLWGVREVYEEDEEGKRVLIEGKPVLIGGKYHWLSQNDLSTTQWTTVKPQSPLYLLVPQGNPELRTEYEQSYSLTGITEVSSTGTTTGRDQLCVSFDRAEAMTKIVEFISNIPEAELMAKYGLSNKSGWNIEAARRVIRKKGVSESKVYPYYYRPFDERVIYLDEAIVGRTRMDVMRHMLVGANLGLCTDRQVNNEFRHVLCTDDIINDCAVSSATRERTYLFPLYLYQNGTKLNLFDDDEPTDAPGSRRPNLAPEFIESFVARLDMSFVPDGKGDLIKTFGPEDVFDYMYAVFHSPTYRSRYAEFLKTDFPRLPLTRNRELFRKLCRAGAELVALHLMRKRGPEIVDYPIKGDNVVERVHYEPLKPGVYPGRVHINETQYFEGVPPEVWDFHVGGYRVVERWLKDRKHPKKSHLTFDDLEHYRQVVSAIAETIRLMAEIDVLIEEHDGWPLGE